MLITVAYAMFLARRISVSDIFTKVGALDQVFILLEVLMVKCVGENNI